MTIDKAIKKLQRNVSSGTFSEVSNHEQACRLGIEALKRIHNIRNHRAYSVHPSLPGETKE